MKKSIIISLILSIIILLTGCKDSQAEELIIDDNEIVEDTCENDVLTFDCVRDYLLTKEYVSAEENNDLYQNSYSNSLYKLSNEEANLRINKSDIEFNSYMGNDYDSMLTEINSVVDQYKEELESVLPQLDVFNEYIKLVNKDFYFKVVLRGETIEDGIHYYSIDAVNNVYIEMLNYYIEEKEFIKISISEVPDSANEIISETRTYSNLNNEKLNFVVESIWQLRFGNVFYEYYYPAYQQVFEFKLLENGSFEMLHLNGAGASGAADCQVVNEDGSPPVELPDCFDMIKHYRLTVEKHYPNGDIVSTTHSSNPEIGDFHDLVYSSVLDREMELRLGFTNDELTYQFWNLAIFDSFNYIDYYLEEVIDFMGNPYITYNATTINTDGCVIEYNPLESNSIEGVRIYEDDRNGLFTVGLGITPENIDDYLECDLKFDYTQKVQELVEIKNELDFSKILEINYFEFTPEEITEYLTSNYLINDVDLLEILTDFKNEYDYLVPVISAPSRVTVNSFEEVYSINFFELISVYDDTDGYLTSEQVIVDIIVEEDGSIYSVKLKAIDSSNNYSNYTIFIDVLDN